jgi:hypothetical protein
VIEQQLSTHGHHVSQQVPPAVRPGHAAGTTNAAVPEGTTAFDT